MIDAARPWIRASALVLGLWGSLAFTPAQAAELQPGCPASARRISVGVSIQPIVSAAPEGANFCLGAGIHRLQEIVPKNAQRFFGEVGAVLSGSRLVRGSRREGRYWVIEGQWQQGERWGHDRAGDMCLPEWPRCFYPEAVFIDDRALRHAGSMASLKAGEFFFDYDRGRIVLADDPGGRKFEVTASAYAFMGGARDVSIQGLVIEKYATPIQYGAVGYNRPSPGWILQGNEIRLNHGSAAVAGTGSRIIGNRIHGNGQLGIGCVGDDILIERNEIARNGGFSGVNPYWEGGGAKCAITDRLIVRGNHVHHNEGMGFWTDYDNIRTLYEDNLVEANRTGGLSHEISYDGVVRNNVLTGNGVEGAPWLWSCAIQIQNSRDVQVSGNIVDTTEAGNGICLIQQNRGSGRYGPYVTVNNKVWGNRIISRSPDRGISGAIADHDPEGMRRGDNRFERNTYEVPNTQDEHWAWIDGFFGWSEYRQRSAQDAGSTVTMSSRSGTLQ